MADRIDRVIERLDEIHDYITSQRGIDSYRKWLVGAALTIVGLLMTLVSRGG